MISTTVFGICFLFYVIALIASITALANKREVFHKSAFWLFSIGFLLHTVALLIRWAEAGEVEVAAFQVAENRIIEGWEWFAVWISHPPWSNLYESLVCFGWGMSMVSLYGMKKFNIPVLPVFAITLSLVVMGAASLLVDQTISPLIPALQSKWIHLHVTMATISYPAFGLAAIIGLFYLVKVGVKNETFGLSIAITTIIILLIAGGGSMFTSGDYEISILTTHGEKSFPLTYAAQDAAGQSLTKSARFKLAIPGAGIAMIFSLALLLMASVAAAFKSALAKEKFENIFKLLVGAGFIGLSVSLALIIYTTAFTPPFEMSQEQIQSVIAANHTGANGASLVANYELHGKAPFNFSLSGNPFEFMLLVVSWLSLLFYFLVVTKREWLTEQLPSEDILDDLSYKIILFAYPFLTLLIITGAVWAYYAWGRYWGWDPKETWSLITWIVYSIYLHVRITHGWEGKIPAAIALAGFGIVIFTYLGVNILLSGLHSYATG